MSEAQARIGNPTRGVTWLRSCIEQITDREFVVEYLPERVRSPLSFSFDMFGGSDRPASFKVTVKGIGPEPHFEPARIALEDAGHVRERLAKFLPADEIKPVVEPEDEPEPEPTIQ